MSFFCLALSALSLSIVQIVQCDFFIFAIHLPNAMGQEIILKKPSKKDTSFSLRSNPRGYSREPIFSVYARALCVLEITSRRIISSPLSSFPSRNYNAAFPSSVVHCPAWYAVKFYTSHPSYSIFIQAYCCSSLYKYYRFYLACINFVPCSGNPLGFFSSSCSRNFSPAFSLSLSSFPRHRMSVYKKMHCRFVAMSLLKL